MVAKPPTKKAQKEAEARAYLERVKAALDEAHAAAKAAYEAFAATAKRSPDGHILDSCGGAFVVIFKPSYRFRKALEQLGEIERGDRGRWHISNFEKHVHSQSITAHEIACKAARDVLVRHFPEEPNIYAPSYID